jgi:hypothetical protein
MIKIQQGCPLINFLSFAKRRRCSIPHMDDRKKSAMELSGASDDAAIRKSDLIVMA